MTSTNSYQTHDLYAAQSLRNDTNVNSLISSLYITKVNPIKPRTIYRDIEHINSHPNIYTSRSHSQQQYHNTVNICKHIEEEKTSDIDTVYNEGNDVHIQTVVQQHETERRNNTKLHNQLKQYNIQHDIKHNKLHEHIYHTNKLVKHTYKSKTDTNTDNTHTTDSTDITPSPLQVWSLRTLQSQPPAKLKSRAVTGKKRPTTSVSNTRRTVKPIPKLNPLQSQTQTTEPLTDTLNTIQPITMQYRPMTAVMNSNTVKPTVVKRPQSATYKTNLLLHKLQSANIQCNHNTVATTLYSSHRHTTLNSDNSEKTIPSIITRPATAPMKLPKNPFNTKPRVASAGKKRKKVKQVK